MFCRPIIICLLVTHTAFALKCHVCYSLASAFCLNVTQSDDIRFLRDCPAQSTSCGLEVTHVPHIKVNRDCVSSAWVCKNGCDTCNTDGCNYGIEIKETTTNSGLEITIRDRVEANIYGICGILLVTGLLFIWCLSSCCSRNDSEEYDDEEVDEEYDFEYEETDEKS